MSSSSLRIEENPIVPQMGSRTIGIGGGVGGGGGRGEQGSQSRQPHPDLSLKAFSSVKAIVLHLMYLDCPSNNNQIIRSANEI